ncbi:PspC domain-containing protein [Shewanella cyperi]|uniref:PspC domain-containing protein n=1 Tax=Shewanella cyperi TaxID=2814292 RepID=A0A974XM14_9GAMM|nr:PspC domain-containing protein [Shewanella cyperi]QSX29516.1 PspC domain-containing protein [Shewanella cyperi]
MSIESRMHNPRRLVCGVAASLAHKFGWSCFWTRIVTAVLVLLNPAMALLCYFALALVMDKWER